jgi:cell division protein ZapA
MESSSVRAKILGTEYSLKADSGREHIVEVAAYVDKAMKEISAKSPDLPEIRIAVLAAVNIADELLRLRQRVPDDLDDRANALSEILYNSIKD